MWSREPIPVGVNVTPPVYIGGGAKISPGAKLGPRAVIGEGTRIERGATVRDSVINGAAIRSDAVIDGAVICRGAVIGRGVTVREDAVVGEGTVVGDGAVIAESVKIWPARQIPESALIKESITHGFVKTGPSFTARGIISGVFGAQLTAADCLRLGQAAADSYKRVGLGYSGQTAARVAAEAIGCGVCYAGGDLLRFDCGLFSCASFAGQQLRLPLTICVNREPTGELNIMFCGKDGSRLPVAAERKLLSAPEDVSQREPGSVETVRGIFEIYSAAAARYAARVGEADGFPVNVPGGGVSDRALKRALELLGCVSDANAVTFEAGPHGTPLCAAGEDGQRFTPEQMLALTCAIEFERGASEIAVPFGAPAAIDAIAERHNASVFRLGRDGDRAEKLYTQMRSLRDGVFAGALICAQMKKDNVALAELLERKVPRFTVVEREVTLRRGRAETMGALSKAACEAGAEFSDGIRRESGGGTVLISPLRGRNAIRIRAEAANAEIAEELCAQIDIDGL